MIRAGGVKRGASAISGDVKAELKLLKTDNPTIHMARPVGPEGKRHFKTQSEKEDTRSGNLSLKAITDLICPIFSYKRVGYGNQWNTRTFNSQISANRAGLNKSYNWNPGRQYWAEYMVMPVYNAGQNQATPAQTRFDQDNFTGNIQNLMTKAKDIYNEQSTFSAGRPVGASDYLHPGVNVLSSSMTLQAIKSMYGLSFDYHGGYQEHTWVNATSCDVTIFVTECQPRQVMSCIKSLGPTEWFGTTIERYAPLTIGDDVLEDYKANLPIGNNNNPIYNQSNNNNTSTDQHTDPHVRINSLSNRTHYKWKCSKEIRIKLQPGERYSHKVAIDPFNFTETAWNKLINTSKDHTGSTGDASAPVDWTTAPMMIPAISKMLVVRAMSELGWGLDGGGTLNAVGMVGGALLHTCTEYHKCRMLPFNFKTSTFLDYLLDGTANIVLNEETDEAEKLETDGLATDSTMKTGL